MTDGRHQQRRKTTHKTSLYVNKGNQLLLVYLGENFYTIGAKCSAVIIVVSFRLVAVLGNSIPFIEKLFRGFNISDAPQDFDSGVLYGGLQL